MDPRRSNTAARLVFFGPYPNDGRNNNRALHSPASLVVADHCGRSNCGVCAMSETTVDFTFGSKGKTRVAPCVGGPYDGKLARYDGIIENVRIPLMEGGMGAFYNLVTKPDGSSYWKFAT